MLAIGLDGTIYVGAGDGAFYAVNPDGSERWHYETGRAMVSSPAISADGTIYAAGYGEPTCGPTVLSDYSCNAFDGYKVYAFSPDGTLKWAFRTARLAQSSPAIGTDGTIFIGADDTNIYAIETDGTERWHFATGGAVQSSPAIGPDGTIYVISSDRWLYAIDPDGTLKWKFELHWLATREKHSPAVGADGTIYVANDFTLGEGGLYAINPDGTVQWVFRKFERGDFATRSSPAIGPDGTIYIGARGDSHYVSGLFAINPDGTEKWFFETVGEGLSPTVYSSPAVGADGTVYFGTAGFGRRFYAVNPDGTEKWAFDTARPIVSSPAIGTDGTVYVGSDDGNLYAFNGDSGGLADSPWPMFRANPQHTGQVATADGQ